MLTHANKKLNMHAHLQFSLKNHMCVHTGKNRTDTHQWLWHRNVCPPHTYKHTHTLPHISLWGPLAVPVALEVCGIPSHTSSASSDWSVTHIGTQRLLLHMWHAIMAKDKLDKLTLKIDKLWRDYWSILIFTNTGIFQFIWAGWEFCILEFRTQN